MVMIFQSEKARKQLMGKGFVFTIRRPERKCGKDWATNKRGGKKITDIAIFTIDDSFSLTEQFLALYVVHSGFTSAKEWIEECRRLDPDIDKWWGELYCVVKI